MVFSSGLDLLGPFRKLFFKIEMLHAKNIQKGSKKTRRFVKQRILEKSICFFFLLKFKQEKIVKIFYFHQIFKLAIIRRDAN